MANKDECCGKCLYNRYDAYKEDFYCDNKDSEYYGCITEYSTICEEYHEN